MSQQNHSSSIIIFQQQNEEEDHPNTQISNTIIRDQSKKVYNKQPFEVKTIPVKIKRTARLKTKNVFFPNEQLTNQSSLQMIQLSCSEVPRDEDNGNNEDCSQYGKSETSSNRQTKPTKTIEQDEEIQVVDISKLPKRAKTVTSHFRQQEIIEKVELREEERGENEEDEGDQYDREKQKQQEEQQQYLQDQFIQDNYMDQYSSLKHETIKKIQPVKKQLRGTNEGRIKQQLVQVRFIGQKLQRFIKTPIKAGYQMQCFIEIEGGFLGIGTKYLLKQKFQSRLLISAKKQMITITPKFLLSTSRQNHSRRHQEFIGILESNFGGTEWNLLLPQGTQAQGQAPELFINNLYIAYSSSLLGSQNLRQMNIDLIDPSISEKKKSQLNLTQQISKKKRKYLQHLETAKPKLVKGKYFIDFKGYAKMASNKNFILVDKDGNYSLLFAKQSQKVYQMNVRYPLSLVQAFSICLSSIDSKLLVN